MAHKNSENSKNAKEEPILKILDTPKNYQSKHLILSLILPKLHYEHKVLLKINSY